MKNKILYLLLFISINIYGQLPTNLPLVTTPTNSDKFPLTRGGASKAIRYDSLKNAIISGISGGGSADSVWTLGLLRSKTTVNDSKAYFVTDTGKEGWWRVNLANDTTADDTGMVIRTVNNICYERLISNYIDIRWYGAKGDGVTDNYFAFKAAIKYIKNIQRWLSFNANSRLSLNRPYVLVPAGTFNVSKGFKIDFNGFAIRGTKDNNSSINLTTNSGVVFDHGTFNSQSMQSFSLNFGDAEYSDIAIFCREKVGTSAEGTRLAQGIRDNGSGSFFLKNVQLRGFQYGWNAVCGSDFSYFENVITEHCDVGQYWGPGSQQCQISDGIIAQCREGLVIDKFKQAVFTNVTFTENTQGHIIFENFAPATRQVDTIKTNFGSVTSQLSMSFNNCWMETGSVANRAPKDWIIFKGTVAQPYRDIDFNKLYIVAGENGVVPDSTSLISMSEATTKPRRIRVNSPVYRGGALDYWFKDVQFPDNELNDLKVEDGYVSPALSVGTNGFSVNDNYSDIYQKNGTTTETNENLAGTNGIRESKNTTLSKISWGFKSGGSYSDRMGIDIQNRRLFLGDPATNEFSISRGGAAPTTGTYALGSTVINIGSDTTIFAWQCTVAGTSGTWRTIYKATEPSSNVWVLDKNNIATGTLNRLYGETWVKGKINMGNTYSPLSSTFSRNLHYDSSLAAAYGWRWEYNKVFTGAVAGNPTATYNNFTLRGNQNYSTTTIRNVEGNFTNANAAKGDSSVSAVNNFTASFTNNAGGNVNNYRAYNVDDAVNTGGSTIGTQTGFRVGGLVAGSTNIAFQSGVVAATNAWNAYFNGTANNLFRGLTRFGDLTAPTNAWLEVAPATSTVGIMRWTSAPLLATPISGMWEYDGTGLYMTIGGVRKRLDNGSAIIIDSTLSFSGGKFHTQMPVKSVTAGSVYNVTNNDCGYMLAVRRTSLTTIEFPANLTKHCAIGVIKDSTGHVRITGGVGVLVKTPSSDTITQNEGMVLVQLHAPTKWTASGTLGTPTTSGGGGGVNTVTNKDTGNAYISGDTLYIAKPSQPYEYVITANGINASFNIPNPFNNRRCLTDVFDVQTGESVFPTKYPTNSNVTFTWPSPPPNGYVFEVTIFAKKKVLSGNSWVDDGWVDDGWVE